jgi:hypothetical protein
VGRRAGRRRMVQIGREIDWVRWLLILAGVFGLGFSHRRLVWIEGSIVAAPAPVEEAAFAALPALLGRSLFGAARRGLCPACHLLQSRVLNFTCAV